MAARTRTIQRTPNVGLTLKMQPVAEAPAPAPAPAPGCTPAPTVARWFNWSTSQYDLETVERSSFPSTGSDCAYVTYAGDQLYHPVSSLCVAQVLGDLCDCAVEWGWMWYPVDSEVGGLSTLQNFIVQTPGTGFAVEVYIHPSKDTQFGAGVLEVTPTVVCPSGSRTALAPIYLVMIEVAPGC